MAWAIVRLHSTGLMRNWSNSFRLISTSPKKSETAAAKVTPSSVQQAAEEVHDFSIEAVKKSKNWVSYGWHRKDKEADRRDMRGSFFLGVTLCLVGTGFIWSYLPDRQLVEWARREAYLVLREREAAGLEPISANIVDPSTVVLPTDEELGDYEIII